MGCRESGGAAAGRDRWIGTTDYRKPFARASTRRPRAARAASLALALLLATVARGDEGGKGTILHPLIPAPSLRKDGQSVRVYLPPSYSRPEAASRRYPLLVMLHGWPGGDGNWLGQGRAAETLDSLSARGEIPEVIALFPNANGAGILGRSMYLNAHDGRFQIQDFIVNDLIAWADSAYRTRPEPAARALIGLSEGGSAAVNLALRHPEKFRSCASLSGEFRLSRGFGMKGVLGPDPGATRILEENSPLLYIDRIVEQVKKQTIYFDCGLDESEWLDQNREFDKKLTALGIPHTYHEFPGGHGWGYWKVHLRDALLALAPSLR
jgi:enterochelin esterase-like enzyme